MLNNEIKYESKLVFDEEKHKYTLNGNPLISCTQLMRKHNLSPDYSGVDGEVLKKSAEYGTIVHKELEMFIKENAPSFTKEVENFEGWLLENGFESKLRASELMVNNDIIAGCIDLILGDDDELIIADFKTTSSIHKDSVSWQLSIYRNLLGLDVKKGLCFHIKGDLFEVVEIPLKTKEEVERLFQCEREGEIYQANDLMDTESVEKIIALQDTLISYKEQAKKIEEELEGFKTALLGKMEEYGILTWKIENNGVKMNFTRILEAKRESVDSTKLKKDHPDIYEAYKKTSIIKPSIRITFKKTDE